MAYTNYTDISNFLDNQNSYVYDIDAIENSIRNIFNTQKGTLPGNPEFGCNLLQYLFEILDPLTSKLIETEIRYALDRWENRVRIIDLEVQEDIDYNKIKILLKYSLVQDPSNEEYTYYYSFQR